MTTQTRKTARTDPATELSEIIVLPRSTVLTAAIAAATFLLGLVVGYIVTTNLVLPGLAAAWPSSVVAPVPDGRLVVSADDDPAIGPADAPVEIIEFGDYQCPFCAQFRQQTLDALLAAYPEQVRFVYRDFPLAIHADAQAAARAAECAGAQETYWQYHDALYATQAEGFTRANLIALADDLDLDGARFTRCLDSDAYLDEVGADLADGQAYGVTGTPTFFINGIRLVGAQPLAAFQAIIDLELGR